MDNFFLPDLLSNPANWCLNISNALCQHCRGAIHGSRGAVRFRRNAGDIGTFHHRKWCSAQRIRITMHAGGNHSIISMNGSPTVIFQHFQNSTTNTNLPIPFLYPAMATRLRTRTNRSPQSTRSTAASATSGSSARTRSLERIVSVPSRAPSGTGAETVSSRDTYV